MLFTSAPYLFAFLPLVVAGTAAAVRLSGPRAAMLVLVAASLVFYGWHNPTMTALLLVGMAVNYALGLVLLAGRSRLLLGLGIAVNLAVLAWFKYLGFFAEIAADLTGTSWSVARVALPLAISFFTFQQIAWLVDCRSGRTARLGPLDYGLFVAFFPQLLAGPIVRANETPPQFAAKDAFRVGRRDLGIGLALIGLGLFKKVALADGLAPYADSVFQASGHAGFIDAWGGTLAYTLQIYFDFSGLTDMAIGSARMVGVRLPMNFLSPYRAGDISDFWKRWHVTLSRFLRDYLYIALGGNRRGLGRQFLALMGTMILGGLWHGAGWTFLAWGALHGAYLFAFHLWRRMGGGKRAAPSSLRRVAASLLTVLAVAVAWVFFRAATLAEAGGVLTGMAGAHGMATSPAPLLDGQVLGWIALLWAGVWLLPNGLQWLADLGPALPTPNLIPAPAVIRWRAAVFVPAVAVWGVVAVLIVLHRGANTAPFLYMVF